jgi:hypothetical protein
MNSPGKKRQLEMPDQSVDVGVVRVLIGIRGHKGDRITDLVLKSANELLRDALRASAENRRGKLLAWQDDSGTFLFVIDNADGVDNCCLAALEMLEQIPSVKKELQLSEDLESSFLVRAWCDIGAATYDANAGRFAGAFLNRFAEYDDAIGADNKVTISEGVFCRLKSPLQSRFVKWKDAADFGAALYATADPPAPFACTRASEVVGPPHPGHETRPEPSVVAAVADVRRIASPVPFPRRRWAVSVAILGLVVLCAVALWPILHSAAPIPQAQTEVELVQSPEWREWRAEVAAKLSGAVTEKTLAQALTVKMPPRPEQAPAALRRDQAIADVLMSYPDVAHILKTRFGIYKDSFLGTGLSEPYGETNYGAASVHEYLIHNLEDNHDAVWWCILDPKSAAYTNGTIEDLFKQSDPKADAKKKALVAAIVQRVKEKDINTPAVIRFATLAPGEYTRKLGRRDAALVFASNLAEVWSLRVKDAARLSGHLPGNQIAAGRTVYIWVFLPDNAEEVVPATWGKVLDHLPEWLGQIIPN